MGMSTKARQACEYCGSSNNVCFWEYNGKEYSKCKTPNCEYNNRADLSSPVKSTHTVEKSSLASLITSGAYKPVRGISEETCRLYNYQKALFGNKEVDIANYQNINGEVVAQKIRFVANKGFIWQGDHKDIVLFGAHLVNDKTSRLWITEGELDAMSLYEAWKLNPFSSWSDVAVSISTGAGGQTAQEIIKNKEFLEKFEEVIFCFDTDKIGQETVEKVSALIDNTKTYTCVLKLKDANEYVKEGKLQELSDDSVEYKKIVPKAIKKPSFDAVMAPDRKGWEIQYPILNEYIRGIKRGRLITLLAGPKAGKSTITREISKHLLDNNTDVQCGFVYLEEPLITTAQAFIALDLNVPHYKFAENPLDYSEELSAKAYEKYVNSKRVQYIDAAFMKLEGKELLYNIKFMINVLKCNIIILDHVTMITYDSQGESSERKDIDVLMKNLRALVNETGATVITICHLSRSKFGKSWSEGKEVTMSDARGSAAIEQISDVIIGLERNLKDEAETSKLKLSVLANRITGKTGYVDELFFQEETGRYITLGELFK